MSAALVSVRVELYFKFEETPDTGPTFPVKGVPFYAWPSLETLSEPLQWTVTQVHALADLT